MRRISIYFLIICCTIIKAQDDLVLVKLQNGKNVKGIIVQGGEPGDHYVRIKKRNHLLSGNINLKMDRNQGGG